MSFKLFFASTFGLIKSTAKIEADYNALLKDYRSFCEFEQSAELKEYLELDLLVKSPTFLQRKKELNHLVFKGSKEEAELKELKKLEKSRKIKKILSSKDNDQLKNAPEFQRYEQLLKKTSGQEFKDRVTYLSDSRKWEKTEDYAKELKLKELSKMPELQNYLKYKSGNAFEFFKKWELVFEDQFESGKLDASKWMTLTHAAAQTMEQNYSQPGDLHAFTDGKNISIDNKSLKIEVRKEKIKGMQWQLPFGLVEKEFDYSSGLVSSAGIEWWKHGILEAKVKYTPDQNLADVIYLIGEESSPQINLVEMGVKNRLGMLTRSGEGIQAETESISGLKAGEYYIFRLEWTSHSLIWKINNREILNVNHHVPGFKMHLNAASIVVTEPASLPHRFEIGWVRFYQHQQKA